METLRYAFGLEPSGDDIQKQHDQIIKDVFRSGSTVRILVEHHTPRPTKYLIERSYPDDPIVYKWDDVANERGEELPGLSPRDVLPGVEVYGQKEILELSKDEGIQVRLLERFQDQKSLEAAQQREKDRLQKLVTNAQAIEKVGQDADTAEENEQRLQTLQEKLKQYKELGLDATLSEQRTYVVEENLFEQVGEQIANLETALEIFVDSATVSADFLTDDKVDSLPHAASFKTLRKMLTDLQQKVAMAAEAVTAALRDAKGTRDTIQKTWQEDKKGLQERYKETLRALHTETCARRKSHCSSSDRGWTTTSRSRLSSPPHWS